MSVVVDGRERYRWPVSTGLDGGPPSGAYQPERMERMWYSRKYDWSPMPHAIFFHHGYAIHGTDYVSRLGRPGLAWLRAAASVARGALFALVRSEGMGRTRIVVSNSARFAEQR